MCEWSGLIKPSHSKAAHTNSLPAGSVVASAFTAKAWKSCFGRQHLAESSSQLCH